MKIINALMAMTLMNEPTEIIAIIAALSASTAVLLIFVILLFACKPFRNLFFHTKTEDTDNGAAKTKKPTKKQSPKKTDEQNANATADYKNDDTAIDLAITGKTPRAKKSADDVQSPKTRVRLAYSDSVPTVPLYVQPKITGSKTRDEDIMKRTHEALMSMSYNGKPRANADANSYVPTIVIPKTNSRDKTAPVGTTNERPSLTTKERSASSLKTGDRPLTTKERLALQRTAPRTTDAKPAAKTLTPTVKTATPTKPVTTAKPATTTKPITTAKPTATARPASATAKTTTATQTKPASTTKKTNDGDKK